MTNGRNYYKKLEDNLQVNFRDKSLLETALTHSSRSEGAFNLEHNERLEFLGDAVLELAMSSILFNAFPDLNEGELTKLRSWLVNNTSLYEIAIELDLPEFIRSGRSVDPENKSVNSDCLEAIIGALFIDQSFAASSELIKKMFKKKLAEVSESGNVPDDPKSKLQKTCLGLWNQLPQYSTLNYPDNQPYDFQVRVILPDGRDTQGTGHSKKAAEQDAARKILSLYWEV
jgi:ribonuclease III